MATIYKGNAQTAKTLGINLKAKVTNVFAAGFNCSTNIDSKEIKTFSTFSMLGKEGRNILTQADIIVGKEVMITKLLENLTPGKDPIATGVVGIPTTPVVTVSAPKSNHYDDLEDEAIQREEEHLMRQDENKLQRLKLRLQREIDERNKRSEDENKPKGKKAPKDKDGANTRRFDEYIFEYESDYDSEYDSEYDEEYEEEYNEEEDL